MKSYPTSTAASHMMNQSLFFVFVKGLLLVLLIATSSFAQESQEDDQFFNGNDFTGWEGEMEFWSVNDGVIVGRSDEQIPDNKVLWSNVEWSSR